MQLFNTSLAMTIIHNLGASNRRMGLLIGQLSTGNRLISAAVDPAGYAISVKMMAQIRGLDMAAKNAQDAISVFQVAEGAMANVSDILIRIRELTLQAANDTNEPEDRKKYQDEISHLIDEVNQIAARTEFNKKTLLDGSYSQANGGLYFQTGANAGQGMVAYINGIDAKSLGLSGYDVTGKSASEISDMLKIVDKAASYVSSERSRLGAYENRMGYTIRNLENMSENLVAARSRMTDMDMAKGMMALAKEQLLQQVSMMVLQSMFRHQRRMIEILLMPLYGPAHHWRG